MAEAGAASFYSARRAGSGGARAGGGDGSPGVSPATACSARPLAPSAGAVERSGAGRAKGPKLRAGRASAWPRRA